VKAGTGESFTEFTVRLTAATVELSRPSVARKVKLSGPP
jgi:hypothetical protein